MPNTVYEKDMLVAQQHWNNFISLVKEDLNEIFSEQRKTIIEIKKFERIDKALQLGKENIDFLLAHKESILALDMSLEKSFSILEAFKKLNNLENAVAIRTYNEILASDKLQNCSEMINELIAKREDLQTKIDMINDLIYGEAFNKELIEELCEKHMLGASSRIAIRVYPLMKTLKKIKAITPKKVNTNEEEVKNKSTNAEEKQDNIEKLSDDNSQGILNYEEDFDRAKDKYDELKGQTISLLNKYYVILSDLAPEEIAQYRVYCSLTEEELKELNEKGMAEKEFEYSKVLATIKAIKLFDAKSEIEKLIKNIQATDYSDKDDIDYLVAYIEEYESLSNNLMNIDNEIVNKAKEGKIVEIEPPRVFFFVNEEMQPMIPDEIKENYSSSLLSIFDKAQSGLIQQKKNNNIALKVNDKEFKEKFGRTIFSARNNKITVSYIKLNTNTGMVNDEGIMILTVSLLTGNNIQDETDKIIKKYGEQILTQIAAIEREDPQQLGLQAMIRDEYVKSMESNLGGR